MFNFKSQQFKPSNPSTLYCYVVTVEYMNCITIQKYELAVEHKNDG